MVSLSNMFRRKLFQRLSKDVTSCFPRHTLSGQSQRHHSLGIFQNRILSKSRASPIESFASSTFCQDIRNFSRISGSLNCDNQRWTNLDFKHDSSSQPALVNAYVSNSTEHGKSLNGVTVNWESGESCVYPFVYLRDCCLCTECYLESAQQRLNNVFMKIDINSDSLVDPGEVAFSLDDQTMTIVWSDGHQSTFKADWLWERKLPKEVEDKNGPNVELDKLIWGAEIVDHLPVVDYDSLLNSDRALYFWLNCLQQVGISLIKNAPVRQNVLMDISKRLHTHIRRTHYGEIFTVLSKPDANSLAYTTDDIPLHIDLAYYNYQPSVQLLHCIEQSVDEDGGHSILADGFYISEQLARHQPDAFKALTECKFIFRDTGRDIYGDFKKTLARPVIELDHNKKPCHIAFNNFTRSSFFDIPPTKVQDAYRAYFYWERELQKPENLLKFKMVPGDIVSFDNTRVLHGRTGFDPKLSSRWLEGCYFDWDELYSAFFLTKDRLKLTK